MVYSGIACMPWVNVPTLVLIVLTELSPSIKWTIEKKWLQGTLLISNANRMWDWTTTTPTTTADRYGASYYKHGLINGCDVRQSAIAFGQPGQPSRDTRPMYTHIRLAADYHRHVNMYIGTWFIFRLLSSICRAIITSSPPMDVQCPKE